MKITHLFLRTLICTLTAVAGAAATDLAVHVTDPRREPVPGAMVFLVGRDGSRQTLTTDAGGACRFKGLAAGQYFLNGEAPGFDASAPQTVEATGQAALDVSILLGLARVRSSVVVTASGTPQTTDEVSKALTVVNGETIRLRADRSLSEALEDVPGLYAQQLGGPLSTVYFKTRGLRNQEYGRARGWAPPA